MKMSKDAFTMMELIFVIVILGILSAVALPKINSSEKLANIAKGRSDIASIRAAILSERQSQIIKGVTTFIPKLSSSTSENTLFLGDGTRKLLMYGIKKGDWKHTSEKTYTYTLDGVATTFTYDNADGTFGCVADTNDCNKLVD